MHKRTFNSEAGMKIMRNAALPALAWLSAFVFYLIYIASHGWGKELVSAYPYSDAELYLHLAWYIAFIDPSGGQLGSMIPPSPYVFFLAAGYKLFGP
ncbi:MAG: hypothetical protein MJA83_01995, partial [Gammaproteobacteria bacterium]|nr:hypothetical protein [Gammaproteobacteria bacterium]